MSKKSKAKADVATPKLRIDGRTDEARVVATEKLATAMPQSPDFPQAPMVQSALALAKQQSDALAANAALIGSLRTQIATALGKQVALRQDWQSAAGQLLATVEVFCNGSTEKVQAFGLDVRTHTKRALLAAPEGVIATSGTNDGELVVRWTKGLALRGFVVQHAADKSNPASYTALEPCTKTRIKFTGLPSGSLVYVRVAAVDPKATPALSPWSEWATGTAR